MDGDHGVGFIKQLNGKEPLAILLVVGSELLITLEAKPFRLTVIDLSRPRGLELLGQI
jgi:hypothetical protein